MKCVAYSLFGYSRPTPPMSFEFSSYLRGMMINVRINRIIYPDWTTVIHTDRETYQSKYQPIFDWLLDKALIEIVICPSNEALCRAMLWRLKPAFEKEWDEVAQGYRSWKYTHVLCRDIDSICTYREAQAVTTWIKEKKSIHCITDSISHNVPMMGGMIGVDTAYFAERLSVDTWDKMMDLGGNIDYNRKGSDQDFLNRFIYPKFAKQGESNVTEHFVLGMVRNLAEGDGRHYSIDDIPMPIDARYKELNNCCGHVGSSGYYENVMVRFLNTMDPYVDQYADIEKKFPTLFFWRS